MTEIIQSYNKILKVIYSCKTNEHYISTYKLLDNYLNRFNDVNSYLSLKKLTNTRQHGN